MPRTVPALPDALWSCHTLRQHVIGNESQQVPDVTTGCAVSLVETTVERDNSCYCMKDRSVAASLNPLTPRSAFVGLIYFPQVGF